MQQPAAERTIWIRITNLRGMKAADRLKGRSCIADKRDHFISLTHPANVLPHASAPPGSPDPHPSASNDLLIAGCCFRIAIGI